MVCDITTGLVANWKFTNNYNDSSGNGYTLTNSGTTFTTDKNSVSNQAIVFDGNDKMTLSHNTDFTTDTFSYFGWIFVPSLVSTNQFILNKETSGNQNHDLGFRIDSDNNWNFSIQNGSQQLNILASATTGWHSFCFTSNGVSDHKAYIDGVQLSGSSIVWTLNGNTRQLEFGSILGGAFIDNGHKLDEIRWYNVVLEQDSIDVLHSGYDVPSCVISTNKPSLLLASDI
ncbi:MAG TPA: hypothetical protein DCL21_00770 [Alphaproteobacteria bacterium]|nr:hypothetical protein [Alphaproteobacteria bacterium]